jgi:DNA-binding CsgD family transcriptional regulator
MMYAPLPISARPDTIRADTVMNQHPATAWAASPRSRTPIDDALWQKIDEAIGGSARFRSAVMIEGRARQPQIMVVVVERRGLPGKEDLRRRFGLTPRESQVAQLMAERLSNVEIAPRLGISLHTARRHSERVLSKLGINNRNHVRTALLDPDRAPQPSYARGVA